MDTLSLAKPVTEGATVSTAHRRQDSSDQSLSQSLSLTQMTLESIRAAILAQRSTPSDPAETVDRWRALASGHWSIVDHFDSEGRRYIVALPTQAGCSRLSTLTPRERQVVALAANGASNGDIAGQLRVGLSTVSTHLAVALTKLRITSRRQLVQLFSKAPVSMWDVYATTETQAGESK